MQDVLDSCGHLAELQAASFSACAGSTSSQAGGAAGSSQPSAAAAGINLHTQQQGLDTAAGQQEQAPGSSVHESEAVAALQQQLQAAEVGAWAVAAGLMTV